MKILKYSAITLLTIALIGSAGYLFASSGLKSEPGYAKLSLPNWRSTNTIVVLNLGPKGLKPAQWMVRQVINGADEELDRSEQIILSVLQDIQGVQLRVYEVDKNRRVFDQSIDKSIASLKQDNWQTLISVREDDNRIVVMQAGDAELISGLSILASTPENAVFLNLVGHLTPRSIALIAEEIDSGNLLAR